MRNYSAAIRGTMVPPSQTMTIARPPRSDGGRLAPTAFCRTILCEPFDTYPIVQYTFCMPRKKNIPDVLRGYIRADGRSLYQLWKDSGVAQAVLGRFMRGERDLNLRTAGRICEALGLELRPKKRKGR